MSKRNWYARVQKSLDDYSIAWMDFRENPAHLYFADPSWQKFVQNRFKYDEEFTWFNKKITWEDSLSKLSNYQSRRDTLNSLPGHKEWTQSTFY